MSELKNDRLLRTLLRQPVDRTPIWLMRQAGRYLPEYREIRKQAGSFMGLAGNPDLACEVTVQPLRRFPLDAAILFSDILTIPDAMGLGLYFVEGEGPKFERPVNSAADVSKIASIDPEQELGYVTEAVRRVRKALNGDVPLIGFSGSPWTIATYMVEGRSTRDFKKIKALLMEDPATLRALLDKLTVAVTDYLNAQIAAGAQAVMLFDTWGGVLPYQDYLDYSFDPMQQVMANLTRESEGRVVPKIMFTKGGAPWLKQMANSGADAIGLDWTVSLADARAATDNQVALQGNLDPMSLYGSPEEIHRRAIAVLDDFGQHSATSGHVFNLGHGLLPDLNPEHIGALVETVTQHSGRYHSA